MKVIVLFAIFLVTFLFSTGPLKFMSSDSAKSAKSTASRIFALINSFVAGVFLATYFILLGPVVHNSFPKVFRNAGILINYPVSDLAIMLGFFLVLFVEQTALKWEQGRQHSLREKKTDSANTDKREINGFGSYCMPDETDTDDDGIPTKGHAEHGSHSHLIPANKKIDIYFIVLFLALGIHSVFEGLAIGLQEDMVKLVDISVAVIVHEAPVAFAMGVSLAKQDTSGLRKGGLLFLFCIMIPSGMVLGIAIGEVQGFGGQLLSAILQAIAAGTFVYVIFFEVLPEELAGSENRLWRSLFIFLGFISIACVRLLEINDIEH